MATKPWDVIKMMLRTIEREIAISLRQINESPEWFDDSFEQQLLCAVNNSTKSTCLEFRMEHELAQRCSTNIAVVGVARNCQVGNDSNPLGGRSGLTIKIEPIGEIVELSDDEEETLVSKIEIDEVHSENNYRGNEQNETTAAEELISNNRTIQNSVNVTPSTPSEMDSENEPQIADDSSSKSIVMGSDNLISSVIMDRLDSVEIQPLETEQRQVFVETRPALVVELRRCDGAGGSSGPKNVTKTAKDKQKRHKCQICEYATHHKGHLNVHMRNHTGARPYRCKICFKGFTTASNLKNHKLIHTKRYKFRCVGCARGFNKESEKEAHDKVCEKRRYECYLCKIDPPYCDRTYATKMISNLKKHMLTHTGEKPFRCAICMRRFALKGNLKQHLNNVHSRTNR